MLSPPPRYISSLLKFVISLVSAYKLPSVHTHTEKGHCANIFAPADYAATPSVWTDSSKPQEHNSDNSQPEDDEAISGEDLKRPKAAVGELNLSTGRSDDNSRLSRIPTETVVEKWQEVPPSVVNPQTEETNWDHVTSGQYTYGRHGFDGSNTSASYAESTSSSYAASTSCSYARSVFSTTSLASSATDLSKNSGYSAIQIARATKELVLVLQDDKDLVPLYKRAIDDVVIGPAKLERNLHRFFRAYANHLGDLAGDRLEYLASRLVRLKARHVARSIMDKYCTEREATHRQESNSMQEHEQSSDEETEQYPVDETEFDDLVSFRNFLVGSEAFGMLRAHILSFILPKTVLDGETEAGTKEVESTVEDEGVTRKDRSSTAEDDEMTAEDLETMTAATESSTKEIGTTTTDTETAQICTAIDEVNALQVRASASHSLSFAKSIVFVKDFTGAALVAFGYLEPPIQSGLTRLRWQCVSASLI
jgi:hypothetical protein